MQWNDFRPDKPHRLLKCPHCGTLGGYSPWSWDVPVSCKECGELIADVGEATEAGPLKISLAKLYSWCRIHVSSIFIVVFASVLVLISYSTPVRPEERPMDPKEPPMLVVPEDTQYYHLSGCVTLEGASRIGRVSREELARFRYTSCPVCEPPPPELSRPVHFVPSYGTN